MRHILITASLIALAACGPNKNADDADTETAQTQTQSDNLADSMASNDDGGPNDPALDIADPEDRPIMQAQVVLDRQGFGPGVIDGKMGMSTENALFGFQTANDLETTGKLDEATKEALARWETIPATRVVRIPGDWSDNEYTDIPDDTAAQAKLDRMGYESLDEKLAERFHTTIEVLEQLNPGGKPAGMKEGSATGAATPSASPSAMASASPKPTPSTSPSGGETTRTAENSSTSMFRPGQLIRVPNIGADTIQPGSVDDSDWQATLTSLGVGSEQPKLDRIVVSKAGKTLKGYQGDKLVALFTVSSGSSEFPLPLGNWKIKGEAYNPPFAYDPKVLKGDKNAKGEEHQLPPGPNGPVGVVWIDLSKEHYGIHGTPDPETIGRAQSHGCVRLTNWDAARLAQMVSQSTKVEFVA